MSRLAHLTYLVDDYDAAIAWFAGKLRFELVEDADLGGGKRWVVMRPPNGGASLLLGRAVTNEQRAAIGKQAGGRVFLFLETDDFARDYAKMRAAGVHFREEPRDEPYGTVAVFEDLYGQPWDLIQPTKS